MHRWFCPQILALPICTGMATLLMCFFAVPESALAARPVIALAFFVWSGLGGTILFASYIYVLNRPCPSGRGPNGRKLVRLNDYRMSMYRTRSMPESERRTIAPLRKVG